MYDQFYYGLIFACIGNCNQLGSDRLLQKEKNVKDYFRYKSLIMESVPQHPGVSVTSSFLRGLVKQYCGDFKAAFDECTFEESLSQLHSEQCLVVFSQNDIRPTQYGLNFYRFLS